MVRSLDRNYALPRFAPKSKSQRRNLPSRPGDLLTAVEERGESRDPWSKQTQCLFRQRSAT
eukprot:2364357-Rhodomonas_salina.6